MIVVVRNATYLKPVRIHEKFPLSEINRNLQKTFLSEEQRGLFKLLFSTKRLSRLFVWVDSI